MLLYEQAQTYVLIWENLTSLLPADQNDGLQAGKVLYTVHCKRYTVHCTLHCTLYTVHCTLYTVHCTLYAVHCTHTVYSVAFLCNGREARLNLLEKL